MDAIENFAINATKAPVVAIIGPAEQVDHWPLEELAKTVIGLGMNLWLEFHKNGDRIAILPGHVRPNGFVKLAGTRKRK